MIQEIKNVSGKYVKSVNKMFNLIQNKLPLYSSNVHFFPFSLPPHWSMYHHLLVHCFHSWCHIKHIFKVQEGWTFEKVHFIISSPCLNLQILPINNRIWLKILKWLSETPRAGHCPLLWFSLSVWISSSVVDLDWSLSFCFECPKHLTFRN